MITVVFACVHNAGRSLTADERVRIFDKFFRLESGASGPRGTGLGLAICKGIVEAHSGHIWADALYVPL